MNLAINTQSGQKMQQLRRYSHLNSGPVFLVFIYVQYIIMNNNELKYLNIYKLNTSINICLIVDLIIN